MKLGITRFVKMAAIAALMVLAGSTAASAQAPTCPTSPNYPLDFTSNQACLTLNGTANFPAPAGTAASITSWSGTSGIVTFTASNSFTAGELITLSGFTTTTAFNGLAFPVLSSDLSSTTFQIASSISGSGAETGTATPQYLLQLTPSSYALAGSAWYNTPQPVAGAFSSTFTFQLTDTTPGGSGNADGIAFLIQNSSLTALGPDGCGIGFGDDTAIGCAPSTGGIPNSLAIEFNTYLNSGIDPSNSDVAIQNCSSTGANSVDPSCTVPYNNGLAVNDLTKLPTPINMADGNVHTVTITYSGTATMLLDVLLDGNDLFPGGVVFNLANIGLTSGNAYIGFTAATGGGDDNQNILSWTFTPGAQSTVVAPGVTNILNFPNSDNTAVYSFGLTGTGTDPTLVTVQPELMTQAACDALVQKNFFPARCFVYQNAVANGQDSSVMFALTCTPVQTCTSNFNAELSTGYTISKTDNPFFIYPGIAGLLNPFPGLLKSGESNLQNPCAVPSTGDLFVSNQVDYFINDNGFVSGKSGGTGSCWVATYDMPGEALPGIKISSPALTTYTQNQVVTASYACSNPSTSQPSTNATGPYLTVASCTQNQAPVPSGFMNKVSCSTGSNGTIACTGPVDTSILGLHAFWVTAIDAGGNTNLQAVAYLVVAPPKKK